MATIQQQKVPIKAPVQQAQIVSAPQKQKVPIQRSPTVNQDQQYYDLETVPVHLRPLIRRIIEQ